MLSKAQKNKLIKLQCSYSWRANCCVCGKPLDPNAEDTEYVKTKRGTENFIHRDCAKKWGEYYSEG